MQIYLLTFSRLGIMLEIKPRQHSHPAENENEHHSSDRTDSGA
jgi:hypothetical protein